MKGFFFVLNIWIYGCLIAIITIVGDAIVLLHYFRRSGSCSEQSLSRWLEEESL